MRFSAVIGAGNKMDAEPKASAMMELPAVGGFYLHRTGFNQLVLKNHQNAALQIGTAAPLRFLYTVNSLRYSACAMSERQIRWRASCLFQHVCPVGRAAAAGWRS